MIKMIKGYRLDRHLQMPPRRWWFPFPAIALAGLLKFDGRWRPWLFSVSFLSFCLVIAPKGWGGDE